MIVFVTPLKASDYSQLFSNLKDGENRICAAWAGTDRIKMLFT